MPCEHDVGNHCGALVLSKHSYVEDINANKKMRATGVPVVHKASKKQRLEDDDGDEPLTASTKSQAARTDVPPRKHIRTSNNGKVVRANTATQGASVSTPISKTRKDSTACTSAAALSDAHQHSAKDRSTINLLGESSQAERPMTEVLPAQERVLYARCLVHMGLRAVSQSLKFCFSV